ncbi:PH-interacting protein [Sesbania bispinosa]|nr:PH-interacting protein [Sesbania bispinosa]
MSAGYDGRTIVWDIWEGMPIRIYEISRFKLVDGKFSPFLVPGMGHQLYFLMMLVNYILSTGQGESQKDAKYDQFFLGDYRPLIQDTHGNVIDQETQIVPYRRNMQDLLCDSAMIPYPEPYQSEFQQRRLGALGLEWRPSSLKLAVGPDFSLDPDYHMLPLADLDVLTEPLPEFIDAMDWEPEIEVFSDDNDSEYNVTEDCSSRGEKGCSSSNASGDSGCSTDNSEGEDIHMDSIRRSKRKKQKTETEIMTSSGRRVKRRNLDECDGNTFSSSRSRKGKSVQKSSRRKSSKSKSSRPQRAAARNALHLFSKITDSESTLQESNIDSDESGRASQNDQLNYSKGKEVSLRRLVLKFPIRDSSKPMHEFDNQAELVGSSSKTAQEATDYNQNRLGSKDPGYYFGNGSHRTIERTHQVKLGQVADHVDLLGKIRWGMVRARSSKPLRVGEAMPSDANPNSVKCPNHLNEKENVSTGHEKEDKDFSTSTPALESKMMMIRSKRGSRDLESPSKHETKPSVLKNSACSTNADNNLKNEQRLVVVEDDNNTRVTSNQGENGSPDVDAQVKQISTSHDSPEPHSHRDKMYKAVYRRSRSHRTVTNLTDGSGLGESTSNGSNSNCNAAVDFSNGINEALHTNGSLELEPTTCDPNNEQNNLKEQQQQGNGSCMVRSPQNVSTNRGQLTEEGGSSSKLTVGLRMQIYPQQGDEVVYLRQGHQEYIEYSRKRESGPWISLKGHIRAVEYCRIQSLEYSHLPGSGDSCCKMTLQFVDPNSSVVGKSFKLTLPEVTSFPDFLVERTRFDAAMQRNWTRRDKCRVWWKNEDNSSGSWWEGRILCEKAKSPEFPESPWERYTVRYKSDLSETHLHSPWELFDADTQWEQPHIDDNSRNKLLSALTKLQQSGNTVQGRHGLQ